MARKMTHDDRITPGICPNCGMGTGSNSGGESWHEECFQEHIVAKKGACTDHANCKRLLYYRELRKRRKEAEEHDGNKA